MLQIYYVKPDDPEPQAVPFIENLSVANGDHVVNGIAFAHDGRLLVAVGSQTNAGMPGALGYLPVRLRLCPLLDTCTAARHSVQQRCPVCRWRPRGSSRARLDSSAQTQSRLPPSPCLTGQLQGDGHLCTRVRLGTCRSRAAVSLQLSRPASGNHSGNQP